MANIYRRYFTLLIASLLFVTVNAQLSFYNFTDPNQVKAIEEDGSYFWSGTDGGLYKWFKSGSGLVGKYDSENGLPSSKVLSIKKDHFFNELWVGTDNGLAMLNVLNQWTVYTTEDGLPDNHISDIAFDLAGNKWFATFNGVTLYEPASQNWTSFHVSDGLADEHVESVDVDLQGNVWFGTWQGVSVLDPANQEWTTYDMNDGLLSQKAVEIATDDTKGTVWVAHLEGFSMFDGSQWKAFKADTIPGLGQDISSIAVDAQSNVWIGTGFGVSMYDMDTIRLIDKSNSDLPSDVINVVNIDADNNKWFGNFEGVTRFSNDSTWTNYITASGLIDNHINVITKNLDNKLMFGTNTGVSIYDGKHWETIRSELINERVKDIIIDDSNKTWFGTTGGISVMDGNVWIEYQKEDTFTVIDNAINTFAKDTAGNIWIGTEAGVSVYKQGTWEHYTVDSGLASNQVNDIEVDDTNTIWFATDAGVSKFDGTTWATYTTSDGLDDNEVLSIGLAPDGMLWFGTFGGVSMFDGNTFTSYTDGPNKLVSPGIQDIAFDKTGNVWFGTEGGISRFNGLRWVDYTEQSSDLIHDFVLSMYMDQDGVFWFGTEGGISRGTCEAPALAFDADTTCLPDQTVFSNQSSKVDGTTIFHWDINDDGSIENIGKNASHQFSTPGSYPVKLTGNNMGCESSMVKDVTVRIKPEVDLNISEFLACDGETVAISPTITNQYTGAGYLYEWSTGETTATIHAEKAGDYILKVLDVTCESNPDTAKIDFVKPFQGQDICMVTVDSITGVNLVVWEKTTATDIASYNIYKLIGNQYDLIGNVVYGDLTVFEDVSSRPEVKAERYAITIVDTCGNESGYSPYHQTIFLGASPGLQPNTVVLDWTLYQEETGAFEPVWYYIFRGLSPAAMELVDSVSSIVGSEWTDDDSRGSLFYKVAVEKIPACDPAGLLKSNNGPFSRSLSNLEDNRQQGTSGINQESGGAITLSPNPAGNVVRVYLAKPGEARVSILSLDGKLVLAGTIFEEQAEINIEGLHPGVYLLRVETNHHVITKRLVKQ